MTECLLTEADETMLAGERGEAARLALRIVVNMARIMGAPRLIDVVAAHVDGCLYHGEASLDFVARLVAAGGQVVVPTTLNTGSLDLLHPTLYRGDPEMGRRARQLMESYIALGCRSTFTCAPYQSPERPAFGAQIAWAESNAIVFANSVLGARTNRYGDFIDICAALTGRVPDTGLHRDEGRRGDILFRVDALPERLRREDVFYPVLGHLIGGLAGSSIPVITGLPDDLTEDHLKALGAAMATSGSVAMFHAVGITPEAATLDAACGGASVQTVIVTADLLLSACDDLTTATAATPLAAISLGTPHFSVAEIAALRSLLAGRRIHQDVDCYLSTSRQVLHEIAARGWQAPLEEAGVRFVVDTCTYITPILRASSGAVMTNSAKWAYYAPGNLGMPVVFGSLRETVESAVLGRIWRDPELWAVR